IKARITLNIEGLEQPAPFLLQGSSLEPALCFTRKGTLTRNGDLVLELEAGNSLGRAVRKIRRTITWTLTLTPGGKAAQTLSLGFTGPHVVYTTLGVPRLTRDPATVVTDLRMEVTVRTVAAAMAKAGESASPVCILHEMMKQFSAYYVSTRHFSRETAWKVPACYEREPKGASCISIVEFVYLAAQMIGLEGKVTLTAYYARETDPHRAIQGGLGDPPVYRRGYDGETWQLFLVDLNNTRNGQQGGVGGMNFYEATLEYEWNGEKYYFPGGTNFVYDSPDKVLLVFRTLAWARWEPALGDWVVMEVVHTYTRSGKERPANQLLP
ncbi:MAG: hypothetical protein JO112_16265, partial [Planctomycetes bacterium]|nr:hypothetical protein [Planctomycetota bacterium]